MNMCVVPVKLRHGDYGETMKTYALLIAIARVPSF